MDDTWSSQSICFTYVGETVCYLLTMNLNPGDEDHTITLMFRNGLRPDVWRRFRERFGVLTIFEFFGSSERLLALRNCSKGGSASLYNQFFYACALLTVFGFARWLSGWSCWTPWPLGKMNTAKHICASVYWRAYQICKDRFCQEAALWGGWPDIVSHKLWEGYPGVLWRSHRYREETCPQCLQWGWPVVV